MPHGAREGTKLRTRSEEVDLHSGLAASHPSPHHRRPRNFQRPHLPPRLPPPGLRPPNLASGPPPR